MTERVIAVDIDLRCFSAWDSMTGQLFCERTSVYDTFNSIVALAPDVVLIECASHVTYSGPKKQAGRQAWVIYNSMAVSILVYLLNKRLPGAKILVSPSSTWTKGLREPVRHKLAGVVEPKFPRAKGRHDLKECQAMIWTYRQEPDLWQPLETYLESL